MSLPGFTAEASLYKTGMCYQMSANFGVLAGTVKVSPQYLNPYLNPFDSFAGYCTRNPGDSLCLPGGDSGGGGSQGSSEGGSGSQGGGGIDRPTLG